MSMILWSAKRCFNRLFKFWVRLTLSNCMFRSVRFMVEWIYEISPSNIEFILSWQNRLPSSSSQNSFSTSSSSNATSTSTSSSTKDWMRPATSGMRQLESVADRSQQQKQQQRQQQQRHSQQQQQGRRQQQQQAPIVVASLASTYDLNDVVKSTVDAHKNADRRSFSVR